MARERGKEHRLRKASTGNPPVEGLDRSDEGLLGTEADAAGLDLRAGQRKQELGRNPRGSSSSVNETLSRYKKSQAQKFSEHTPEAREARDVRNAGALSANTTTDDAGQPNPFSQGSASAFDGADSFGEAKRRHRKKPKKPEKITLIDDAPQDEAPTSSGDMPFHAYTHGDEGQTVGATPQDGNVSSKESTLSHERPSVLQQERERLSHKRTQIDPVLPNTPKNRKPDYSKHMTHERRPPAPVGEIEKSQNATFEHSPKTSPLEHDEGDVPLKHEHTPAVIEIKTAAKDLAANEHTSTNVGHDSASVIAPAVDTISGEALRDTTPAVDTVLSQTESISDAANISDSSVVGEEHRAADAVVNKDDRKSSEGASGESGASASSNASKFSERTKSGKKLEKAEHKYQRSAEKLQTAKDNLPTKRVLRTNKEFDSQNGKMKPRLRFEQEVKTQHEHLRGSVITRPLKTGVNAAVGFAHTKVFQVQEENVGVKAAHKGEMLAEGSLRYAYRHHKLAPYRKVQKLEERTRKLSVWASYRKALHENPKLRSNPISRMIQKRRIKCEYAQAAREAKRASTTIKKTATVMQRITTKLVMAVKSNPKVLAVLGLLFLMIVMIFGLVSSCSSIASSVGQSFAAITYLAEDECIDDASVFYSYLETDLRQQIINIEDDWPDINEFRMNIGAVGHCPLMLMAYLTAVHHDFTFADIEDVLREIFEQQYTLELSEVAEERRRWEQVSWEPDEYDWVYYDWYVLYFTLTSQSFFDVLNARMDEGQRQHYGLLMQSRGLRQIVMSPFDFYWMPFISSHYGWRIHPITGGKQLHMGTDIALPTGTPILAATNGTVTFAGDMGGYGLVVFIDNGEGIVTVYAHCDTLLVSTGQTVEAGDVIATVGTTGDSTGPHLHFEIIRNGRHLNPVFFAFSNTF